MEFLGSKWHGSFYTISYFIGIGSNYNASDPVVHLSFSEAEKRMKKLERDYQHTYKNYKEIRVSIYKYNRIMVTLFLLSSKDELYNKIMILFFLSQLNRHSFYMKARHSSYRSSQAGFCIGYYKDLQEQLLNDLEKLMKAEATQRRTEKSDYVRETLSRRYSCTAACYFLRCS